MSEPIHNENGKALCPVMAFPIGNTNYIVEMRFNDKTKETLDDKLKRLICEEILKPKTVS